MALSKALDMDDTRKLIHAQRTAVLAHLLASQLSPQDSGIIYYAALLHDIGGIGLFDHIVHHPSPAEQAANPAIRVHPVVGAQIVDNIPGLEACVPIILKHHERYDGHGYPAGRDADHLPLSAQILRGADSFDLLLHHLSDLSASDAESLTKAFSLKAGKEVSPEIAGLVCQFIEDRDTFAQLIDGEAVQARSTELNQGLPGIEIKPGTDIIGTLLGVFAQVIDAKHAYTAGHSQRVSKYSVQLGLELELPHDEITRLKWAAMVHDLGKVCVPRSLLDGATALNQEEKEIIRRHPLVTIELLSGVTEISDLGYIGALHHERWDGTGYPYGLRGEDIPWLSRIICVADAFDALTSDRAYHNALGTQAALEQLGKSAGTQFDPQVFDAARQILWSGIN